MSDRSMIRAFMAGLIDRAGGMEAAAALIGARLGQEVSKGSVSKRQSGALDWPLVEIIALEDAVGDACVRRWLSRSLPEDGLGQGLLSGLAEAARETGEAVGAVAAYASGQITRAEAAKEVQDAVTATKRLAARLEAEGRS